MKKILLIISISISIVSGVQGMELPENNPETVESVLDKGIKTLSDSQWDCLFKHIQALPKTAKTDGNIDGFHLYKATDTKSMKGLSGTSYQLSLLQPGMLVATWENRDKCHSAAIIKRTESVKGEREYTVLSPIKSCFSVNMDTAVIKDFILNNINDNNKDIAVLYQDDLCAKYKIRYRAENISFALIITCNNKQKRIIINSFYPEIHLTAEEEKNIINDLMLIVKKTDFFDADKNAQTVQTVQNNDLAQTLGDAIRNREVDKLMALMNEGVNPNLVIDKNEQTPLMIACQNGWYDMVLVLLDSGADATIKDKYQKSALDYAAVNLNANEQIEHWLIVDSLAQKEGGKLLRAAVKKNKNNLVQCLLKMGVNVNYQDENGYTALMHCTNVDRSYKEENEEVIGIAQMLFNAGADIDIQEKHTRRVTDFFTNMPKRSTLPRLLQEYQKRKKEYTGTPLDWALETNNSYQVAELLPSLTNAFDAWQILEKAKKGLNHHIINLLEDRYTELRKQEDKLSLEKDQDTAKKDQEKKEQERKYEERINKLSQGFSKVLNDNNNNDITNLLSIEDLRELHQQPNRSLLTEAVAAGRLQVVQQLLDKRIATIFQTNAQSENALVVAYKNKQKEILEWLLETVAGMEATTQTQTLYAFVSVVLKSNESNTLFSYVTNIINTNQVGLLKECIQKDITLFSQLLSMVTVSLDTKDDQDKTILMYAAELDNSEVVNALLKKGASITIKDNKGETAYSYAQKNQNKDIEKLFKEKESKQEIPYINPTKQEMVVDQQQSTNNDTNPFIICAKKGTVNQLKKLFKDNPEADIDDIVDAEGNTLLLIACKYKNEDIIKYLLFRHANIFHKNYEQKTALFLVLNTEQSGNILKILKSHLEKFKPEKVKVYISETKTLLADQEKSKKLEKLAKEIYSVAKTKPGISLEKFLAIDDNNTNELRKFVQIYPDINQYLDANRKMTPLYIACEHNKVNMVKMLLNQGARINESINWGARATPLYVACEKGHTEVVKLLLSEKNIDINKVDKDEATPLYVSCQNGHSGVVKLLLLKGADIHKALDNGTTPLHAACVDGYSEIVKLLLLNGADINKANNNGATPLHIACYNGNNEIVKLLLSENFIDINKASNKIGVTPLYVACQNGHIEVVKLLLLNGADINKANNNGATPLYVSCQNGHSGVVKLLLSGKDIDINKALYNGTTPLHAACQQGYSEIVKLLLNGADINKADKNGETPLYVACQRKKEFENELAKKFSNDTEKESMISKQKSYEKIIELLKEKIKIVNNK